MILYLKWLHSTLLSGGENNPWPVTVLFWYHVIPSRRHLVPSSRHITSCCHAVMSFRQVSDILLSRYSVTSFCHIVPLRHSIMSVNSYVASFHHVIPSRCSDMLFCHVIMSCEWHSSAMSFQHVISSQHGLVPSSRHITSFLSHHSVTSLTLFCASFCHIVLLRHSITSFHYVSDILPTCHSIT